MSVTEFVKDAARVEALKRGVATMKARKPSEPTSWFYQGAVHGVSAEAIAEAASQDPGVEQIDQQRFWNQCPHSGAPSADFLLWHRAYVYYFERILRDASGDRTLSVPYWNYTGNERAFPSLFGDAEENAQGEPTNPLYEPNRELLFVFGLYELADGVVTTDGIFAEKRFFGEMEDQGFAGGVGDSNPGTRGLIERQPHDLIHVAVGGAIGDQGGLMSSVSTAAFDPIFWPHHTNIDRLWSRWETLPERTWGSAPSLEWFHSKPWFFHDSDGSVKNLPRYSYLKYRDLAIRYDDDDPKESRLSDTLPAGVDSPSLVVADIGILSHRAGNTRLSATSMVTLPLNRGATVTAEGMRELLAVEPPRKKRVVVELTYSPPRFTPSVSYHVYLVPRSSDVTRLGPASRQHLGILNLFGVGHKHGGKAHGHARAELPTQAFDVTKLIDSEKGFDPTSLSVVIQPFDLFRSTKKGVAVARRAGDILVHDVKVMIK